ncbi:unnamed protein product [Hydatigera taeniaeformis]|uniref:Solute carrier family 12 member 8 n=1 Tax=Hydatigena taeniaeformis TaxID=6205 RepID=A0A0R3WLQ4_HYDTA|nr:unnamed protein product [Hydatigera taeniaeformis]
MQDSVFDEDVHIKPEPGVVVNVSRLVPPLPIQSCRNLQKLFAVKKHHVLFTRDVIELTCGILFVLLAADILTTLCTKGAKRPKYFVLFTDEDSKRLHEHFRQTAQYWHCHRRLHGANHVAYVHFGVRGKCRFGRVFFSYGTPCPFERNLVARITACLSRHPLVTDCYGICGSKFVPANSGIVNTIFALLLLEFRTKAPGAQTIAQFVGRRFGIVAHSLTITISLVTALYTLTVNVIVGSKVLDAVTEGVSKTAIVSIVFILVGAMVVVARRRSYSLTLYIFNTTILLICAFLIFVVLNVPAYPPLGSMDSFYNLLVCYKSDCKVEAFTTGGFNYSIISAILINLIQQLVHVVHDQALWETSINLPPNHGVLGLLLATILASCIPFVLGIVCGLGFRALESAFFNAALLNATHKASGLLLFATPIHLLEKCGISVIFIVLLLLLVTSCMFSIIGASSIVYHDILATYIRPFRKQNGKTTCLLCGKRRGHLARQRNICRCRSMLECAACHTDTWIKEECRDRPTTGPMYGCQTHGTYREYTDKMSKSVLHIAFIVMAGMIPIFIIFSDLAVCSHAHVLGDNVVQVADSSGITPMHHSTFASRFDAKPVLTNHLMCNGFCCKGTCDPDRADFIYLELVTPSSDSHAHSAGIQHILSQTTSCGCLRLTARPPTDLKHLPEPTTESAAVRVGKDRCHTKVVNFLCFHLCTPFVGCLCLTILWARLSKAALLIGYFASAAVALILHFVLAKASSLGVFQLLHVLFVPSAGGAALCTTSSNIKHIQLIGLGAALLGGFLLPALITRFSTTPLSPEAELGMWSCVQEIDNPLMPWSEVFTRQTDLRFSPRLSEKKPALSEVRRALTPLRRLTRVIVAFNFTIFLGFWQILGHIHKHNFNHFFFYVSTTLPRGCKEQPFPLMANVMLFEVGMEASFDMLSDTRVKVRQSAKSVLSSVGGNTMHASLRSALLGSFGGGGGGGGDGEGNGEEGERVCTSGGSDYWRFNEVLIIIEEKQEVEVASCPPIADIEMSLI